MSESSVNRQEAAVDPGLVVVRREGGLANKIIVGALPGWWYTPANGIVRSRVKDLGSDAVVEIHAGKDHFNLMTPDLRNRIRREMTEAFLEHHDNQ